MNNLLERQKKAINFFNKQQAKGMISHAYLLVGEDALEMAHYMALSIFCEAQEVGPCMSCSTCQRVDEHSYADYKVFSQEESIKKEDIQDIKKYFSTTTLEKSNHSVYTLDKVETASVSAMNSLLKFLEEPRDNVTAILTTQNPKNVLETIKSRCLILQLENNTNDKVVDIYEKKGYETRYIYSLLDSYQDEKQFSTLIDNEKIKSLYDTILKFNQLYPKDKLLAATFLQADLINKQKISVDEYRVFMKMFIYLSDNNQVKEVLLVNDDRIRTGMIVNLLIDNLVVDLVKGVSS
ncbi:MAG TPA: hypothetical protein VIG45_07165 [Erysipelothrix sp.]